ncbi:hypothetical protein OEW28_08730 [Defluviimonas sp. WL0002]|uniref:Lipoprotein n=2 Tax=Albidovulum marisflavi TaxID=2984159 RepID=A0ABT2ZCB6_9RHOB|nr:hypothetical protein [Defluviimonas sp. WL0002]
MTLLAAACTMPDPKDPSSFQQIPTTLRYEAPVSQGEDGSYFRVAGANGEEAVTGIAQRLTDAGYAKLSVDVRAGKVSGTTTSSDVLDCGTFEVATGGHRARLGGTTADSALPAGSDGDGALDRRQFSSRSRFTVHVAQLSDGSGFAARVTERHRVQVVRTSIAGDHPPKKIRAEFTGKEAGSLGPQETCRSSGSIRRVLTQP